MYRKWVKRLLDILLSGAALVVLCIPMGVIALWIKLDSPGPVLFRQKRVGKKQGAVRHSEVPHHAHRYPPRYAHPYAEEPRCLYHQKRALPAENQPG